MAVYKGSRYEDSYAGRVVHSDGVVRPVLFRNTPAQDGLGQGDVSYQVREGDRLDRIAFMYFGTENLWWLIADANDGLLLPDPLKPGTILRIPRGTTTY
jgi:nucleoid-associated protein YgaU